MASFSRFVVAAALAGLLFLAGWFGVFASLDRLLGDLRFTALSRPASGELVFVEIDSSSLVEVGVWPWPRQVHAQILDRLLDLGARDVAFDIDFSTHSTPDGDKALAAALARAGGFTYLASFEQPDGAAGRVVLSRPIPEFLAEATPVLVNVQADRQGMVDRVTGGIVTNTGPVLSLAGALAGDRAPRGDIVIDYGIDLRTIDRISVASLLDGSVGPQRIRGKQVIVGASALELRDTFVVPRFGHLPGSLLQAGAAESLKAGRVLEDWAGWPGLGGALLLALAFSLPARRLGPGGAAVLTAGAMIAAELAALGAYAFAGILVDTGAFHATALGLLTLRTVQAFWTEYGERRRAQARLAYLARHDEVTGLKSRRGMIEALRQGKGPQTVLAIGLLRLDLVRGALGQGVHGAALRQVGERIVGLGLGEVGQVGEDVLALGLKQECDEAEILGLEEQISRALQPPLNVDGHVINVDCAIGAATGDAGPEHLIARAELALAQARLRPGVPLVLFAPEFATEIGRRRRIDLGLRQALAGGGLTLVFQPQVRLRSREICGVEALLRWTDPELGVVSPAEFIPLAEETGLIAPLGAFVLEQACREAVRWNWGGRLAVNVSAAQLQLGDVAADVQSALARSGFPADRLDIEITESLLADRSGRLEAMIVALRTRGVGVAIDDFGTGYSALSYLSGFTFDKLKIDQSFVRRLAPGSAQAKVVASIVELAHSLGKATVAEGIETEEQRELLTQMGCEIGQGYLFGRPVPGSEIEQLLARAQRLAV